MNITLGTFMKIAITALMIAGLVFGVGTTMIKGEATKYKTTTTTITPPTVSNIETGS